MSFSNENHHICHKSKKWNINNRFGYESKNKCCCHCMNFHQNYEVVYFNVKQEDILFKTKC